MLSEGAKTAQVPPPRPPARWRSESEWAFPCWGLAGSAGLGYGTFERPIKGSSDAMQSRESARKGVRAGSVRRAERVCCGSVPRPVPILDLRMIRLRGSRTGQVDSAHPPYETTPSDPREKAARSERVRERGRLAGPAKSGRSSEGALALLLRVRCAPVSRPTRLGPLLVPSVGTCKSRAIRRRCRVGRERERERGRRRRLRCFAAMIRLGGVRTYTQADFHWLLVRQRVV